MLFIFFALRNDAGIIYYIFILRLRGCPGLPKIKFGGWLIGDERLPGAFPCPPPCQQHPLHPKRCTSGKQAA